MKLQQLYSQVQQALQQQNNATLQHIVLQCPPTINTQPATIFLQSSDPYYAMVCMDSMASAYLFGLNYDYAEIFAKACFTEAYQYYNAGGVPAHQDLHYYMSSSLYYLLKLYFDTGRYADGIHLYTETNQQYPDLFTTEIFAGSRLQAAEIFLENNEVDTAKQILLSVDKTHIPLASNIQFDRLHTKIVQLTSEATLLPDEVAELKQEMDNESHSNIIKSLDKLLAETPAPGEDLTTFYSQVKHWKNIMQNETNAADFQQVTTMYEEMLTYFKGIASNDNESGLITLRHRLQQTQKIFFDDMNGFSVPHLEEAVKSFTALLIEFEQTNNQSDIDTTLWSLYICYKRMEQYSTAAEMLEKMHVRLEEKRSSVHKIEERAGVFSQFPHFFAALAEMYYLSNQPRNLLNTIEASKGRHLADKMLSQIGKEAEETKVENLFTEITALLKQHSFHYFSLFTDEEWSYSVLVTATGKIIAAHIPIGQKQLSEWVQKDYPDPAKWKVPASGLFGKKNVDVPLLLSPFLKPIEIALNDGSIKQDDHIAYSPDGYMHLFPLHYIKQSNQRYLIENFSVSKVQSGNQLLQLLQTDCVQPKTIVTVSTPALQDEGNDEKWKGFDVVGNWLQQHFSCKKLTPSIEEVVHTLGENQLIHFATHGVFPKTNSSDARKNNPYYSSGLLLQSNDIKPSLDADFNYYETSHLLSPKKLIEAGCNLKGAHVSIQACVSGRAKEGIGGDALGMEWAFYTCGVTSLLSANWDINVHLANAFCILFYEGWLTQKWSKARAYRQAVINLMKNTAGAYLAVNEWGGLTLTGDFR